ncbi:MAG: hypothetical protein JNM18_13355 [Planctomycetaceae bacterium]|nr:hypothetical protein [Planctomycetaceae bacterium]
MIGRYARHSLRILIALGLLTLTGCVEKLNTRYGEMSGQGLSSVNGTSVFAEMVRQSGHHVSAAYRLTPRLRERAEVIVWFPDSFDRPSDEVREWFEHWLHDDTDRTLIYVGRDFDASIVYWTKIQRRLARASPELFEMRIDLSSAIAKHAVRRQDALTKEKSRVSSPDDYEDWFTFDYAKRPSPIKNLEGDESWLADVDATKAELEANSELSLADDAEPLLETDSGDPLVAAVPWGLGEVIVVNNGSFMLNLPLVNHEHRKLAGHLIDELGSEPREVIFLESGPEGPSVSDQDDPLRSGLEILTIYPFNWILLHLSIIGVIFAFARWPIFGLVQPSNDEHSGDFGRHIAALGRLLRSTGNRAFAQERVRNYQQLPHSDESRRPGSRR